LPSISLPAPASLQSYVLAAPSSSGEIKRRVTTFDHCLQVYHCGVSAMDQSSCQAHVAQLTKFSSLIAEQNRVLLQSYFDWESYFRLLTRQLVLRYYSPTALPPGILACFSVDTLLLVPRTVVQAYLRFVTCYCVCHFFQGVRFDSYYIIGHRHQARELSVEYPLPISK
jgi:hypothetical protein